jgi:1-acyl-sn-glycerol-3-phosphate acyltransferase
MQMFYIDIPWTYSRTVKTAQANLRIDQRVLENIKEMKEVNIIKIVWRIIWILIRLLLELFAHFEVRGLENIEKIETPIIVVTNHASFIDPFAIGVAIPLRSSLIPIRYIIKKEYDVFPLSLPAKIVGGFFVDQKRPLIAFKKALEILKNGEVLGMFPEGTRTKNGKLQEFEKGAAWLAQNSGAPILPIGISGTFALHGPLESNNKAEKIVDKFLVCTWKIFRFFLGRYHIMVTFGEPFKIDLKEDLQQATQIIKSKVFELLKLNH